MLRRNKYVWSQLPLLRLFGPYLAGLIVGFLAVGSAPDEVLIAVICILLLILIPLHDHSVSFGFTLMLIAALIGWSFAETATPPVDHGLIEEKTSFYRVEVTSSPQKKPASFKTTIRLMHRVEEERTTPLANQTVIAYFDDEVDERFIQLGSILLIRAQLNRIMPAQNPYAFDYASFMASKGIQHQVYVPASDLFQIGSRSSWLYELKAFRQELLTIVHESSWSKEGKGLMSALLLGSKTELSYTQRDAYADAGAMHVLAVSGLHVGIVYLLLASILGFLTHSQTGRLIRLVILLFALWLFALLTGLSPSVTRAATMFSFMLFGEFIQRKGGVMNAILVSAFFLLLIDPRLIFDVGFQLSYVAVFGIVSLQPLIEKWFRIDNWILSKIWALTSVSLAAQLATFPIALYYFHQFPMYFLLSNLLVIPLATVLLPLGLFYLALHGLNWIGSALEYAIKWLTYFMNEGVQWIQTLPSATLDGYYINLLEVYLLYSLIIALVLFLLTKRHYLLLFSLITVIGLIFGEMYSYWKQCNREEIWVYQSNQGNALSYISGHSVSWLSDEAFDMHPYGLRSVSAHWDALGVDVEDRLHQGTDAVFYRLGEHLIAIPNDAMRLDASINIDLLWVIDNAIKPELIINQYNPEHIILSQHLYRNVKEAWMSYATERGKGITDMYQQAAQMIVLPSKGIRK